MTKGQKIQRAMERIINPKPKADKQGCGNTATCLPRKEDQPIKNTNNPPVA